MSAALVESVREAVKLRALLFANSDVIGMGHEYYRLDLPAILAALTEAESLRAQVVAGQARGVALREAGEGLLRLVNDPYDKNTWSANSEKAWNALRAALSTPTDTAALRAFGERCVLAGWVGGNNYAFPDEPEELVVADIPPDAQQQIAAIVDRVLGGS